MKKIFFFALAISFCVMTASRTPLAVASELEAVNILEEKNIEQKIRDLSDEWQRQFIEAVNDFVVKFANVNGSGSASANALFARSILRMGVSVSPRNIFPSNIQGLPTWYEVRICERAWQGRRGGVDLMVAMNPQTWDEDLAEIETGGYLLYDSTKDLLPSKFRDDVRSIGIPLTQICNDAYSDARQRQLFKNIIYVGALGALLNLDPQVIAALISEQFKGKEALMQSNVKALAMGRDYALSHFDCPTGEDQSALFPVSERWNIDRDFAHAIIQVFAKQVRAN